MENHSHCGAEHPTSEGDGFRFLLGCSLQAIVKAYWPNWTCSPQSKVSTLSLAGRFMGLSRSEGNYFGAESLGRVSIVAPALASGGQMPSLA